MRVYASVAGWHSKSPSCAQPCEKEIYDFVFEHGKGTAIYDVYTIYIPTNNSVFIKHRTQNHHPYSIPLIIVLSKIFPSIFPIAAIHTSCNIYIVMFVILVHCQLPGSSRFFLSFIKKHHKNFLWFRCSVSRKFHCHHDGSCTSGIISAIPL